LQKRMGLREGGEAENRTRYVQGERGTKGIMDVAVLAATAFVVYKGVYPLWVTVGGISAVTWNALSHAVSMTKA
jgi:hypothetical protein